MQQADALALRRPIERRDELFGRFDRLGPAAERPGQRREIGILELGGADPLRIFLFLVYSDGSVGAIVDQDDEQAGA